MKKLTEFAIIRSLLHRAGATRRDVVQGIGDDAALLRVPEGQIIAVTTDTLVEGVHFPAHTSPADIAYKAVAVNLSDLAAMGAEPAWLTMALTVPEAEEAWLEAFSQTLHQQAEHYDVALVGGDTTQGPLSVTVQALGWVPENQALRRHGANPGDWIYVTGYLGDAGLGLAAVLGKHQLLDERQAYFMQRLNRPAARVAAGIALRQYATSAIDISDGLIADLGHIMRASGVGAIVQLEHLPLSPSMRDELRDNQAWPYALYAGDDYELCFTIPRHKRELVDARLAELDYPVSCIGRITSQAGLQLLHEGKPVQVAGEGYEHFT